jgi:hypothetical protein
MANPQDDRLAPPLDTAGLDFSWCIDGDFNDANQPPTALSGSAPDKHLTNVLRLTNVHYIDS